MKRFKLDDYEPIYVAIGLPPLTLKDIYNPNHVIFGLNHSRYKIKRRR